MIQGTSGSGVSKPSIDIVLTRNAVKMFLSVFWCHVKFAGLFLDKVDDNNQNQTIGASSKTCEFVLICSNSLFLSRLSEYSCSICAESEGIICKKPAEQNLSGNTTVLQRS